ncbi:IncV family inclusion membrane protein [Chlamydia sp. 17-3921]|uniref:IncV family inclusion membrane protein n=1 Tax=Chlamydia sp. 17-3921 TaxID=2675798 RepID=UPI00191A1CA8|nr:IncV family inclusion membrane protein [Chlamydia sp. 17-3921]
MSNPINKLDQARTSSPIPSQQPPRAKSGLVERLKTQPAGLFRRFITLPDRNPKMRYVFDLTIIAIAIISIISILAVSQGQGLLLYGLIPGFVIGALGITLLISDVVSTPRAKKIADTLTAVLLPIIVLGIATALIASAYFSAGGTALLFANPQFIMGVITIGLFFMSLSKVTCAHIKRELIDTKDKTTTVSEVITPSPSPKDAKKVARETKKLLSHTAKKQRSETEVRKHTRLKKNRKQSQGTIPQERPPSSDSSSSSSSSTPPPVPPRGIHTLGSKKTVLPTSSTQQSTTLSSTTESTFQPIDPAPIKTPATIIMTPVPIYPSGGPTSQKQPSSHALRTSRISPTKNDSRDKNTKDDKQQQQQDQGESSSDREDKNKKHGKPKPSLSYDKKKNPFDSEFEDE